jgi:hypothetical protein
VIGRLLGDLEGLVDRSYERIEQELRNAHAIGKLAVTFGAAEARRRVLDLAGGASSPSQRPAPSPSAPPGPSGGPAPDSTEVDRFIPDYDDLSASQVVVLLGELDEQGLDAVSSHESRGRGRRTILNRVAQLVDERAP